MKFKSVVSNPKEAIDRSSCVNANEFWGTPPRHLRALVKEMQQRSDERFDVIYEIVESPQSDLKFLELDKDGNAQYSVFPIYDEIEFAVSWLGEPIPEPAEETN